MSKLNHYRVAFYLCAAIALMEAVWILFFVFPRHEIMRSIIIVTIPIVTILGLLIQSNLIRALNDRRAVLPEIPGD
jgi:hypothetical protein